MLNGHDGCNVDTAQNVAIAVQVIWMPTPPRQGLSTQLTALIAPATSSQRPAAGNQSYLATQAAGVSRPHSPLTGQGTPQTPTAVSASIPMPATQQPCSKAVSPPVHTARAVTAPQKSNARLTDTAQLPVQKQAPPNSLQLPAQVNLSTFPQEACVRR